MQVSSSSGEGINRDRRDGNMPPPFKELMQGSDVSMDALNPETCMSDLEDKGDGFSLPDAHALLHVTSRRKIHHRKVGSFQASISTYSSYSFTNHLELEL